MRTKRQLDDPRALRDPASGAVIFAFSVAGPGLRPLPGPVLVALLGALGMGEPTVRATILRMRRGGWLSSTRRGPTVEYALTPPARALAAAVLEPIIGRRPTWDGVFHGLLFTIPESGRSYRDALRRAAVLAGFGMLRPGLLVTTDAGRWSRIEPELAAAPPGSRLFRVDVRMAPEDARAAAAEAWPLESLAATYREQAAAMLHLADRHRATPPTGPSAVRVMWEAMTPISATAIGDPMLPAELLPAEWPSSEIGSAFEAVGMVLGPGLTAHLDALLAASGARP
jgi:phenylacetic acid degradation operon negative regulatory protein